jgi:hypothetical protein
MPIEITSGASHVIEAEVFERVDWLFDSHHQLLERPVPGTWCPRQDWMDMRIGAAFCCPACGDIRFLISGVSKVDYQGHVTPDVRCESIAQGSKCGFVRKVVLKEWLKKPVYSVVVLRVRPDGTRVREDMHVQAMTREEAVFQAAVVFPDTIVEVGRTVGVFAHKDGKSGTLDLKHAKLEERKIRSFGGLAVRAEEKKNVG